MKKSLSILSFSILLFSCTESTEKAPVIEEPEAITTTTQEVLETVPRYVLDSLYKYTTNIEGTMYQAGGSFSIGEENSAKKFIEFINQTTPSTTSKNQLGHLMFLNNGENLMIISVYSNDNQVYGRFDIDGKSYYNVLTGQINDMFTNIKITPKKKTEK